MSAIKVEGSIGQSIASIANQKEDKPSNAQFARLIQRSLPACTSRLACSSSRKYSMQRYHLTGGHFDGVVCDVSECDEEIRLKVSVTHDALYRVLKELTEWLVLQMRHSGYLITLEVEYVQHAG